MEVAKLFPTFAAGHRRLLRVPQLRRVAKRTHAGVTVGFLKFKPLVLQPGLRAHQGIHIALENRRRTGAWDGPIPSSLSPCSPVFLAVEAGGVDLAFGNFTLQIRRKTPPAIPMATRPQPVGLAHAFILPTHLAKDELFPQMGLNDVQGHLKRLGDMPPDLAQGAQTPRAPYRRPHSVPRTAAFPASTGPGAGRLRVLPWVLVLVRV